MKEIEISYSVVCYFNNLLSSLVIFSFMFEEIKGYSVLGSN